MCRLTHTATHRTCSRCRVSRPLDSFQQRKSGKYATTKDGKPRYFSCCRDCNRVMAKERRARIKAQKSAS
jgi:hypothetical protein